MGNMHEQRNSLDTGYKFKSYRSKTIATSDRFRKIMHERKKKLSKEKVSLKHSAVERADNSTSVKDKSHSRNSTEGARTASPKGSSKVTSRLEPQRLNDIGNIMSTQYALKSMEKAELRKIIHFDPSV